MIQIIDNKKVEMTADEHQMYQRIVRSYTTNTNKGEDYFVDLFETDQNGIIIFLKPPSKRQTSFEIWMFLMALCQHQHLRIIHQQVDEVCAEVRVKLAELSHEKLAKASAKISDK